MIILHSLVINLLHQIVVLIISSNFDEERYLISFDDGSIEPLKESQVTVSDDKKTVTFVALSKASGKANLYATVLKGDIKTKLKSINDANVINIINSNDTRYLSSSNGWK